MNIEKTNTSELNAVIKIKIGKEDYSEKVEKTLKDYRNKANIPGFRKGKIPTGLIQKMYGKAILVEEVNKVLVDALSKYIVNEKLPLLGEPLPSVNEQDKVDFETMDEFVFAYDVALAPEFEVKLSKRNKFPYYEIKIEDKHINEHLERQLMRFGKNSEAEVIADRDIIKGVLVQTDADGNEIENGIVQENAMISFDFIKNSDIKAKFEGAQVGFELVFSPMEAFGNETEVSSLLNVEKTNEEALNSNYRFTLKSIEHFQKAEINQDLFDKMYGEGVVTSEEEARAKIKEELENAFASESDYKFKIDAKEKLVAETQFDLPVEFLKRWLLMSSQRSNKENKLTPEMIENDWANFENDLRWQLIKEKVAKSSEIKVTFDEVKQHAKNVLNAQFAQYGMGNLPDEHMENYTVKILQKEEEYNRYAESKMEEKIGSFIKDSVKLDTKEVSTEEFNDFFKTN